MFQIKSKGKGKGLDTCYSATYDLWVDSWPAALYNLGSCSWLAWANGAVTIAGISAGTLLVHWFVFPTTPTAPVNIANILKPCLLLTYCYNAEVACFHTH